MTKQFFLGMCSLFVVCLSASGQVPQQSEILETQSYQIRFPGAVQKMTQTVPSKVGDLLMEIYSYEVADEDVDSNFIYMVVESQYPDSTVHSDSTGQHETYFRGAIQGALRNGNGKLISETSSMIGKYPARTIEMDYNGGKAVVRLTMLLKDSKMIMMQTLTSPDKYPNAAVEDFFSSFKLK